MTTQGPSRREFIGGSAAYSQNRLNDADGSGHTDGQGGALRRRRQKELPVLGARGKADHFVEAAQRMPQRARRLLVAEAIEIGF